MAIRDKLLACGVLADEAARLVARRGLAERVDCEWLEPGLHERPDRLREELDRRIRASAGRGYRAVLLLFGLCGRGTEGLTAPAGTRLVLPRVHDCVDLHLGSAGRRLEEQAGEPGTLWLSRGFLGEGGDVPMRLGALSAGVATRTPEGGRKTLADIRAELARDHGPEAADYLIRELAESWTKNYSRVVYLAWDANPRREEEEARAAAFAREQGWRFATRPVDLRLIRMLLEGEWPESEFVVVEPGRRVEKFV